MVSNYYAGVRVFFYLDDRERKLDTSVDKMMLSLTTFAAELEREKARQRTRDAMLRKARAGHVTGGRVFGYDNLRVDGHVERRINDREAPVIRRMFELAALGHGLRVIAHTLNAEGSAAPRPQRGRPVGWAPSSVRDVLARKRLLRGRPTHEQTVLRAMLDGPITIGVPEGDSVPWEAQPDPWGVLRRDLVHKVGVPSGAEPLSERGPRGAACGLDGDGLSAA